MGRKAKSKSKGREKAADEGGAVSQPHSPPLSAVGQEGGGKGGDVSGVEEDQGEKSIVGDVVPGETTATTSPRSPTPPPEDLPTRKAGAPRRPASDTQQSMVDVSFFMLHDIIFNPVQTTV